MILAGLVSVADWVGSNSTYFECEVKDSQQPTNISAQNYLAKARSNAGKALAELGWLDWPAQDQSRTFDKLFPKLSEYPPRDLQTTAIDLAAQLSTPGIVVIEAPMGEGKTEAAMYLADHCNVWLNQRGCYFALPTQATSNQMFSRVHEFLKQRFAGKSVLLRLCHGLLVPTAGSINWNSPEVPGGPRRQAMVFQRPVLLRRSALGNVRYALKLSGVPARERSDRAYEALCKVGLEAQADRAARVMSGGEQQRLALARVWALRPEILFLDEPTASLDPGATHEIENVILALHAAGTKIVMVTHNLGQVRRLADEILYLHQGRLLERAPAEQFLKRPASSEAARFLEGELSW